MGSVQTSGIRHGAATEDIMGCLFFHVKDELREFARRIKEFHIDIHLTQFDPRVLGKGISAGMVSPFGDGCFDRIETSNMVDYVGVRSCLSNWGPLLNGENRHASILMHSKTWHTTLPNATAQSNPRTLEMLMQKCQKLPSLVCSIGVSFHLLTLSRRK